MARARQPGPLTPARPLQPPARGEEPNDASVLVVSRDARHRRVLRSLIETTDGASYVGAVGTLADIEHALLDRKVDIAMLDGPSLGSDELVAQDALRAARLRGVIRFCREAPASARRSVVPTSVLDNEGSQRFDLLRTRLSLMTTRARGASRTLSSTALQAARDLALRHGARHDVGEDVRRVLQSPLELIVLVGGRGSSSPAHGALRALQHVGVPVVCMLDDPDAPRQTSLEVLRRLTRARVFELTESTVLRRLERGIYVPASVRGLFFDRTSACLSRLEYGSLGTQLASVADIGPTAAAILLGGEDGALCSSLRTAARAGTRTFALDPSLDPGVAVRSRAVESALRTGAAKAISSAELTWLLGHAVPMRE